MRTPYVVPSSGALGLAAGLLFALTVGPACSKDAPPEAAGDGDGPPVLQRIDLGDRARAATPAPPPPPAIELKPITDRDGQVSSYLPLPTTWQITPTSPGKFTITAPGGVVVNETESAEYVWADDPFARETLSRSDKQLAPPLSAERIIEEGIKPLAEGQGYTLVDTYPLPGVQAFWEAFGSAIPNTRAQRTYRAVGTEWKGPNDARSLIAMLLVTVRQDGLVDWRVYTTELEAPAAAFDAAKQTYLDAVAHTQMNPEWQRAQGLHLTAKIRENQAEAARWMRLSEQQHKQRMADIAAQGRAILEAGRRSSEALDRSHASFMNRSNMNSAGHAKTIDGIHERTVVVHPETGTRYQVGAGHKYYWGDGDNGYVGTDDPNWDPRLDPDLNQRPWVRYDQPDG